MILSCEEIIFQGEEASVELKNESEQSMAFKIRVNKLELISVTPCRKVLPSHQMVILQLKIIKQMSFEIKMQISYGPVGDEGDSQFDSQWITIPKDRIRQLVIPVVNLKQSKKPSNAERMTNQKEENISEGSQEESEKLSLCSHKIIKSVKQNSSHETVNIAPNRQIFNHKTFLQRKLENYQQKNEKLSEQMKQNARLLAKYRNMNQYYINERTNRQIHEETEPWNILNLMLLAILLILIGYFLSNITIFKPKF